MSKAKEEEGLVHRTSEGGEAVLGQAAAGMGEAHFPSDVTFLASLTSEVRERFIAFMKSLDEECVARDHPYGKGSLWKSTGAECWVGYFHDGASAVDALDEDLSYD